MKIIGGEFGGRRIEMPKGPDIRPTSDKAREGLFNIIKGSIGCAFILDLFAGSGAFGIEALSRGAKKAVFVDSDKRCVDSIRKSLGGLPVEKERFEIYKSDVLKAIRKLGDSNIRFDIIFLDPPYYGDWVKKGLLYLGNYDILLHSTLVICEHFKKDAVPEEAGGFAAIRRAAYGDTVLTFYKRRKDGTKT